MKMLVLVVIRCCCAPPKGPGRVLEPATRASRGCGAVAPGYCVDGWKPV